MSIGSIVVVRAVTLQETQRGLLVHAVPLNAKINSSLEFSRGQLQQPWCCLLY
jgi:hypothetical protein